MHKAMLILLLAVSVITFPSLTVAVKKDVNSSSPLIIDSGLDDKRVAACISCH